MNTTHVANTSRFVALAAALLVTAVEWTGFSEIFLTVDPSRSASVQLADASTPQVVVTARLARR